MLRRQRAADSATGPKQPSSISCSITHPLSPFWWCSLILYSLLTTGWSVTMANSVLPELPCVRAGRAGRAGRAAENTTALPSHYDDYPSSRSHHVSLMAVNRRRLGSNRAASLSTRFVSRRCPYQHPNRNTTTARISRDANNMPSCSAPSWVTEPAEPREQPRERQVTRGSTGDRERKTSDEDRGRGAVRERGGRDQPGGRHCGRDSGDRDSDSERDRDRSASPTRGKKDRRSKACLPCRQVKASDHCIFHIAYVRSTSVSHPIFRVNVPAASHATSHARTVFLQP